MAKFRLRKNRTREFRLYAGNTTLGWRVVQHTSADIGERKVAAGVWQRVYESVSLRHIGYQPLGADRRTDEDLRQMPQTSVCFTAVEMEIIAGAAFSGGRSRTYGKDELARTERIARGLAPEDEVERLVAKLHVWRQVTAKKKDILRVWPKSASALQ